MNSSTRNDGASQSLCWDCGNLWNCPRKDNEMPKGVKFISFPNKDECTKFPTLERIYKCKNFVDERPKPPKKYVGRSRKVIARLPNERKYLHKFDSIKEASEKMYINKRSISRALKGDLKTAGGYVWRYARTRKKEVTND